MVTANGQTQLTPDMAKEIGNTGKATPFAWVDLRGDGPNDPETHQMLIDLGVPSVGLKVTGRQDGAGVFSSWQGILVGTTWVIDDDGETLVPVHFAWEPQGFITVRWGGDAAMQMALDDATNRGPVLFDKPTLVPGVVLQWMLASVADAVTSLGQEVDDLDLQIIDQLEPGQLDTMRVLRQRTAQLQRRFPQYAQALRDGLVAPAVTGMDDQGWQEFQLYATGVQDVVSHINGVSDGLRNALQDYQTQVGNKQGERINQLTIVSIIFLPVTFLTGYFGMNFGWMDNNLNSLWSWLLLGIALPIVMVIWSIVVLSRRGYLHQRKAKRAARQDSPAHALASSGSSTPATGAAGSGAAGGGAAGDGAAGDGAAGAAPPTGSA